MKLKRLFIAPHLLRKSFTDHQSMQKSSTEESINPCLNREKRGKKPAKAQRQRQNHSEAGREIPTDAPGINQRSLRGLGFPGVVF